MYKREFSFPQLKIILQTACQNFKERNKKLVFIVLFEKFIHNNIINKYFFCI